MSELSTFSQTNILETKLLLPIFRSKLVRRDRLTDMLRVGMRRKLTLIVAPAGYGKTTVLNEWYASTLKIGWPVGWISLDHADNEPSIFWTYFLKALQIANPNFSLNYENSEMPIRQILSKAINCISEERKHFDIVLDDFQVIHSRAINDDLAFWIDHMPYGMHLVIASRTSPQFPFSHYRVNNQLLEINARDLLFDLNESITFFHDVMNVKIETADITTLVRRTEGWIAGLQLAALSLKNHPNIKQFIEDFNGSQRHIFDYLTNVALEQQEQEIQDFLIKVSILDNLSATLCNFMLKITDGQQKLESLEQANAFIIAMDEKREWYRFHPLFADLLRTHLNRFEQQSIRELNRLASIWFSENGYLEKAIPHALDAGDFEFASKMIEDCMQPNVVKGNLRGVLEWIQSLPEAYIQKRPRIGVYAAEANYLLGRLDEVEENLKRVLSSVKNLELGINPSEEDSRVRRELEMIRIAVECIQEDCVQGIRHGSEALHDFPKNTPLYGMMNHYLGYAFDSIGDLDSAFHAFKQAGEFAIQKNIPNKYVLSQCELARVRKSQGRLNDAKNEYLWALKFITDTQLETKFTYLAYAGLADIYYETNLPEKAEKYIQEISKFFANVRFSDLNWLFPVIVCTSLTRCLLRKNDIQGAVDYFSRTLKALEDYVFLPHRYSEVIDTQVRIWLKQDNEEAASRWLETKRTTLETDGKLTLADNTAMARISISMNNPEEAIRLLEMVQKETFETGRWGRLIEVLILKAIAASRMGKKHSAFADLNTALCLAGSERYFGIFFDEGEAISRLLTELKTDLENHPEYYEKKPDRNYLDELISTIPTGKSSVILNRSHPVEKKSVISPFFEPLTDRELDVLKLLIEGDSSNEIAQKLVISLNTVKVHVRNIYQKLDVNNRRDAVERAIELEIISY